MTNAEREVAFRLVVEIREREPKLATTVCHIGGSGTFV
jgi:hypothetical protein